MKHVSDYYMFYESGLVPWVHYVPFGEYDKDDVLPVRIMASCKMTCCFHLSKHQAGISPKRGTLCSHV